jgi:hypothetical protein
MSSPESWCRFDTDAYEVMTYAAFPDCIRDLVDCDFACAAPYH